MALNMKEKKQMDELSKIQGMSNSKLYKQYGNSIVVDVMCAMFRNLNIKGVENWNNYCKKNRQKNNKIKSNGKVNVNVIFPFFICVGKKNTY